MNIAAPSLIPDALPAVTVPSFLNAGLSFARFSIVVLNLGNSSVSNTFGSPFLCGITTGTIHIAPNNTQNWPSVYAPTKNVYVIKVTDNKYVKFQVTDFYGEKGDANKLTFQYLLSEDGKF